LTAQAIADALLRRAAVAALRAVTCRSVSGEGRVAAGGIDPAGFSGHSLRAGFATSADQAGAWWLKIRSQTGHASEAMLARYVRDGDLFIDNAAGALL
jgi:integrase